VIKVLPSVLVFSIGSLAFRMREHSGRWPMAGCTRPRYQRPERLGNRSRCEPASKRQCSSKAPRPRQQRRLSVLAVRAGRVTNSCSLIAFGGVPVSKPQNASKIGESTAGMHACFRVRQSRPITSTRGQAHTPPASHAHHVEAYLRDARLPSDVSRLTSASEMPDHVSCRTT
jgi:hypothetical protein